MSAQAQSEKSRYKDTPTYTEDGNTFFGLWERPSEITLSEDAQRHRVASQEVGRLDVIAGKYYNDRDLWWVIAAANNIVDAVEDVNAGDVLYIPEYREVVKFIARSGKARRNG